MCQLDEDGIWKPQAGVVHREDEYHETAFEVSLKMQREHFGYRGRHPFLLATLRRLLGDSPAPRPSILGKAAAAYLRRTHNIPTRPLNQILAAVFDVESKVGLDWAFLWGTSILGILRKPGGPQ